MDRHHRLDLMAAVGLQTLGHLRQIDGRVAAKVEDIHLRPQPRRHFGPAMAETPRGQHQHPVAGGYDIAQRSFPSAVAVADIHRHMTICTRHALQVGGQRRHHLDQLAFIDIGGRAVHRAQHRVGHDRGAGNGEVRTTGGEFILLCHDIGCRFENA